MKVHDLVAGILLFFLSGFLIMNNCLCDVSTSGYRIEVVLDNGVSSEQEGVNYVAANGSLTLEFTYEEGWGSQGYWLDDVWNVEYDLTEYVFTNVMANHDFVLVTGMVG